MSMHHTMEGEAMKSCEVRTIFPDPLPWEMRLRRAQTWPWNVWKCYRAIRKYGEPPVSRIKAYKLGKRWFHRWVWGYQELPK